MQSIYKRKIVIMAITVIILTCVTGIVHANESFGTTTYDGASTYSVDYPYTEDENTPSRTYGEYTVKSSLKTLDGRVDYCLEPNKNSPDPEELIHYVEQAKDDPVFYSILSHGYGGDQDIFTEVDGDAYDQYCATIMALVRYIGNTNAWEGLDHPYQAFDYCPAAQRLFSYAKANPVDISNYKLMYILPGEGAPRDTQSLVALSAPRHRWERQDTSDPSLGAGEIYSDGNKSSHRV